MPRPALAKSCAYRSCGRSCSRRCSSCAMAGGAVRDARAAGMRQRGDRSRRKTAKALRGLQLPVNSAVGDGHGGWYVADIRLRRLRRDGSVDETWRSPCVAACRTRRAPRRHVAARLGGPPLRRRPPADRGGRRRGPDASSGASAPVSGACGRSTALADGNRAVYVGGSLHGLLAASGDSGWQRSNASHGPPPTVADRRRARLRRAHRIRASSRLYFAWQYRGRRRPAVDGAPTRLRRRSDCGDIGALDGRWTSRAGRACSAMTPAAWLRSAHRPPRPRVRRRPGTASARDNRHRRLEGVSRRLVRERFH